MDQHFGRRLWVAPRQGASRRRDCHSAAPPSPYHRRFNEDGEEPSAKRQSGQRLGRGHVLCAYADTTGELRTSSLRPTLFDLDANGFLHIGPTHGEPRVLTLRDYETRLVWSLRMPPLTVLLAIVGLGLGTAALLVAVNIVAVFPLGVNSHAEENTLYICSVLFSLYICRLEWAHRRLVRAETVETFMLVPRQRVKDQSTAEIVVVRCVSSAERNVWVAAIKAASSKSILGVSLGWLRKFVAQNQQFMNSPGKSTRKHPALVWIRRVR